MVKKFLILCMSLFIVTNVYSSGLMPLEEIVEDVTVEDAPLVIPKNYALNLGPKVGVNYAMAGDPEDLDLGMGGGIGFNVGLALNARFLKRPMATFATTGKLGVQLEAMYSLRSLATDTESIKMSCFEIPVLFQWWFLKDVCLELGPTFTGVFSTSPKEYDYYNTIYQLEKIKGYDVMLTIGAEYQNKSGFIASLRYNMGNSDLAGNFRTKVSTISLGLGWMFNLAK